MLDKFSKHRATAVLRTKLTEHVAPAMTAAIDGGFKIVEFTLTTPDCLSHVSDFRFKYDKNILVGCGTVMTVADAKDAIEAGAEFLVTPVLLPEVIEFCASRYIVCVAGTSTPTEAYNAYKLGAPIQKIFPGVAGGPAWISAGKNRTLLIVFYRLFETSPA